MPSPSTLNVDWTFFLRKIHKFCSIRRSTVEKPPEGTVQANRRHPLAARARDQTQENEALFLSPYVSEFGKAMWLRPQPPLPQEAQEALQRSEEEASAWHTGAQRRPGGFAELRPGIVRLTGAGYIGKGNASEPRTPILTAEQEELIHKMNIQVDLLLAVFPLATGRSFAGSTEDLDSLLRLVATHSGGYHRRVFLEKLVLWKLSNSINARGIL